MPGTARRGLHHRPRRRASPRSSEHRPDVRLRLLAEQPDRHRRRPPLDAVSRRSQAVAPAHGDRRRGLRRVLAPALPAALTCCPAGPRLVVTRTMSKAFGAGRAARSATWPPTRPWSTRCSWCGCRTTCPSSPRPSALAALAYTDELLGYGRRGSRPSATGSSPSCAAIGLEVTDSDANFVPSATSRTATRSGRRCSTGACWSASNGVPGWLRVTAGTRRGDHAPSWTRVRRSSRSCASQVTHMTETWHRRYGRVDRTTKET